MRIAIVGAGMAGLSCAEGLCRADFQVALFDKGRAAGGRMSTRRIDTDGTTLRFDHGAQYFTVRDSRFAARVAQWSQTSSVARWPAAGDDAWVGVPAMNAPLRAMAETLDVSFGTQIERIARDDNKWRLHGENAPASLFDAAIIAVPAEQAGPLLAPYDGGMAAKALATISQPCWTVMAAFASRIDHASDTIRDRGAIGWAARNSAKPGREAHECWVIQASPTWSAAHIEDSASDITTSLIAAFADAIGREIPSPLVTAAHRWRFARSGAAQEGAIWNRSLKLGTCGDWLIGPRVEDAWLSGRILADTIIQATEHG